MEPPKPIAQDSDVDVKFVSALFIRVCPREGFAERAHFGQQEARGLATNSQLLAVSEHALERRAALCVQTLVQHGGTTLGPGEVVSKADGPLVEERESGVRVVISVVPPELPTG